MNTPAKARAETYKEMWNFIIEDLKVAVDELGWEPLSGEYGRITKGFCAFISWRGLYVDGISSA